MHKICSCHFLPLLGYLADWCLDVCVFSNIQPNNILKEAHLRHRQSIEEGKIARLNGTEE